MLSEDCVTVLLLLMAAMTIIAMMITFALMIVLTKGCAYVMGERMASGHGCMSPTSSICKSKHSQAKALLKTFPDKGPGREREPWGCSSRLECFPCSHRILGSIHYRETQSNR